ncbi:MAG TPA: hypothetical protein VIW24_32140 [Aldersonia sp.]
MTLNLGELSWSTPVVVAARELTRGGSPARDVPDFAAAVALQLDA